MARDEWLPRLEWLQQMGKDRGPECILGSPERQVEAECWRNANPKRELCRVNSKYGRRVHKVVRTGPRGGMRAKCREDKAVQKAYDLGEFAICGICFPVSDTAIRANIGQDPQFNELVLDAEDRDGSVCAPFDEHMHVPFIEEPDVPELESDAVLAYSVEIGSYP